MNQIYNQYMYSYPHKTAYKPVESAVVKTALRSLLPAANASAGNTIPAVNAAQMHTSGCGLYLHLPFCRSKCGYCNLFSVAAAGKELIKSYLAATQRQAEQFNAEVPLKDIPFTSLTFGGGTPSLLPLPLLEQALSVIQGISGVTPANVYSVIEVAPADSNPELISFLKSSGFKRLSIGVQSFCNAELKTLQRAQTSALINKALSCIAAAGFEHFNLDLIYGIPGQSCASFEQSVHAALQYNPTEVFIYPLYLRPQTGLAHTLNGHDPRNQAHMLNLYRAGRALLLQAGYKQVSMRRFSKVPAPAGDCGFENNLALGCGGRSYLGNTHICAPYSVEPKACKEQLKNFCAATNFTAGQFGYILNSSEECRRYTIKNLLHTGGINIQKYTALFGAAPTEHFAFMHKWFTKNLIAQNNGCIQLTAKGLELSDYLGPQFISEQVAANSANFYTQHNG